MPFAHLCCVIELQRLQTHSSGDLFNTPGSNLDGIRESGSLSRQMFFKLFGNRDGLMFDGFSDLLDSCLRRIDQVAKLGRLSVEHFAERDGKIVSLVSEGLNHLANALAHWRDG